MKGARDKFDANAEGFLSAVLGVIGRDTGDNISLISEDYIIVWSSCDTEEAAVSGHVCHERLMGRADVCPDCPIQETFRTGRPSVREKWFEHGDGTRSCYEVRSYPTRDPETGLMYLLKIGHNITPRKMESAKRRGRIEKLERALAELAPAPEGAALDMEEPGLTGREIQVLRLLAQGLSNAQIAKVLTISPHTVKSHVVHVFNKLGH